MPGDSRQEYTINDFIQKGCKKNVVQKCCPNSLPTYFIHNGCPKMLSKNVVKKCCKIFVFKNVVQKCCQQYCLRRSSKNVVLKVVNKVRPKPLLNLLCKIVVQNCCPKM